MKPILYTACFLLLTNAGICQERNLRDDGRKIKIPVVVHVLYSKADENIDDSLVINELNDLNLDFSARNNMAVLDPEFSNLIGMANIEFYLLDTILQHGTKGIQHISAKNNANKDKLLINANDCLNVFIGDHGNASDILSDRVNLYYDDVGKHNHVLTHETGHWLGLYHIWGKIGSCGKVALLVGNHNDEIEDTPEQWKCTDLSYSTLCPPSKKIYYKGHKIMYNNFMDYSGCRCLFTPKQVIKMRNNIIEQKAILFTSASANQ